jgi:hypothetical protein
MPAELVEHGPLRGQDAPVRLIGSVGAVEDLERLLEFPHVGERAAVSSENRGVARVLQRSLLQHRHGLRALAGGAQRLGIADGGRRIPGLSR